MLVTLLDGGGINSHSWDAFEGAPLQLKGLEQLLTKRLPRRAEVFWNLSITGYIQTFRYNVDLLWASNTTRRIAKCCNTIHPRDRGECALYNAFCSVSIS